MTFITQVLQKHRKSQQDIQLNTFGGGKGA
jgi:hypothetical protein